LLTTGILEERFVPSHLLFRAQIEASATWIKCYDPGRLNKIPHREEMNFASRDEDIFPARKHQVHGCRAALHGTADYKVRQAAFFFQS
jgi:hypothetical protein